MHSKTRKGIQAVAEIVVIHGINRMESCGVPMGLTSTGLYFLLTGLRIALDDPETGKLLLTALYEGDAPDDSEVAKSMNILRNLIKAILEKEAEQG